MSAENRESRSEETASSTRCRRDRVTGLMYLFPPASRTRSLLKSGERLFRRAAGDESGQVIIVIALLGTVLLSMLALVADTGSAYGSRRQLQNSVDAAALAGVMEIAEERGPVIAESMARQYVADNLPGMASQTVVTFPDPNKVQVEVETEQSTFFARIFGVESMSIRARATAQSGLAGQVNHLMPLIVPQHRVAGHVGAGNEAVFELGDERPLEALSILYEISGTLVTYTVTYVNTGNQTIDLEMWSPVPTGAAYVTGSATGGGALDGSDLRWAWSGVAAGDSRSANYVVEFSSSVNPANEVFAAVNGGPAVSSGTGGPQLGFFWLTDFNAGSGGTPDYDDWIINGYPNPIGIGDLANGTGVRASLKAAMDARIARDPSVVLPLYNYTGGGGHKGEYHVVGFAEFVITGFKFTGNPKHVTGYFTDGTVTPGAGGGAPADYGVTAIWLSQ